MSDLDDASPDTVATPRGPELGKTAVSGFAWTALNVIGAKLMGLIVQIVLGWQLLDSDYAAWAIIIGGYALVMFLDQSVLSRILIQQGERIDELARPALQLARRMAMVAGALLVLGAPLVGWYRQSIEIAALMMLVGLSLPLATVPMIYRARLLSQLRFREQSQAGLTATLVGQISTIAGAVLGLGAFCFVLPYYVIPLCDRWLLSRHVRDFTAIRSGPGLDRSFLIEFWPALKWLIIASVGVKLGINGDYLVLGLGADVALIGRYYFAYQLTASLGVLLIGAMPGVMLAMLSKVKHDPKRIGRAFTRSLSLLSAIAAPFALGASLLVPAAVHLIWQGKWDAVIPAAQILLASQAVRLLLPVANGTFEGTGRWRLRAAMLWMDAIILMLSALVGLIYNDLTTLAICVGSGQVISAIIQLIVGARIVRVALISTLMSLTIPLAIAISSMVVARWVSAQTLDEQATIHIRSIFETAIYMAVALPIALLLMWRRVAELYRLLPARLRVF